MMNRRYGPKRANHPSIGELCPACTKPFKEGDFTTLISLGPGDDPEEQAKARAGMSYRSVGIEVHWDCAGGEEQ